MRSLLLFCIVLLFWRRGACSEGNKGHMQQAKQACSSVSARKIRSDFKWVCVQPHARMQRESEGLKEKERKEEGLCDKRESQILVI